MRFARIITTAVLAATLVGAGASTAGASNGPPDDHEESLRLTAARILATAAAGGPLEVVTTTRTSTAPSITSTVAPNKAVALDLIMAGLSKPTTIGVDMAQPVSIEATNDPYRSSQWALNRLSAETAWSRSTGSGVVVAVIDTGVSSDHPDLAGHVLRGKDFVGTSSAVTDRNGHGTHVAGIIAAVANNDRGIAGLARHARILPVRVLDSSGSGDTASLAKGIVWAADHGAQVINLSLSSTRSDSASQAAVAYAQSKNVVVVAAAGNRGCGASRSTSYPAAYDGVLGVGAVASDGSTASYSSCGSFVDVVAPGSDIVSTMIANPNAGLQCPATYCRLSGTSMAAPYAAAAAALEIARLGSGATQARVRTLIESTADDVGARGVDTRTGHGKINPRRMLDAR